MHARQPVPPVIRDTALAQAGVVSRMQARQAGLADKAVERLIAEGAWNRLVQGVYLIGTTPASWESWAWTGILLGGADARLGFGAAAWLHGLIDSPPETIDVLVPAEARIRDRNRLRFTREKVGMRRSARGEPPRTGVDDTVLDLLDRLAPDEVPSLIMKAVGGRRTTPQGLRSAVERRRRVRHRRLLVDLLAEAEDGIESPLESRYRRDVERAHGLPSARRQVRRGRYRSDVDYDEFAVLVELDGRLGHDGADRFRDFRRDNHFALSGRITLRYGSSDVLSRPCSVAGQVGAVLQARGWTGNVGTCQRCRRAVTSEWKIDPRLRG